MFEPFQKFCLKLGHSSYPFSLQFCIFRLSYVPNPNIKQAILKNCVYPLVEIYITKQKSTSIESNIIQAGRELYYVLLLLFVYNRYLLFSKLKIIKKKLYNNDTVNMKTRILSLTNIFKHFV